MHFRTIPGLSLVRKGKNVNRRVTQRVERDVIYALGCYKGKLKGYHRIYSPY